MTQDDKNDVACLIEARRDYTADTLRRSDLASDPIIQLTHWLQEASDADILDATAMSLATTDAQGQAHSRIVLLKGFDDEGLCWYTYQKSDKARQLAENPKAALLFYWNKLERQVRIEGKVEMLNAENAESYFQSRPEGSRFSAAASIQSAPIDNRAVLERRVAELHKEHINGNVPRPEHWGGYRLQPHRFEFWQGRADRLHDRFIFERQSASNDWTVQRISP